MAIRNSEFSHQEIGIEKKDYERDLNHTSPNWVYPIAILRVSVHGSMIFNDRSMAYQYRNLPLNAAVLKGVVRLIEGRQPGV
jgi:hypothetical protein